MRRERFPPTPSDRNLQLLRLRVINHKTYRYIGSYFNISWQRAWQIVTKMKKRGLDKTIY